MIDLSIATTISLIVSLCALTLCVFRLRRTELTCSARVERLEDILTRLTREEVGAGVRISRLERALRDTQARQDTLECRASSGPRIESALRVARQGTANENMLRDLGLSPAEASLLLRLHADREEANTLQSTTDQLDAFGEALDERSESQAASLARMLAGNDLQAASAEA